MVGRSHDARHQGEPSSITAAVCPVLTVVAWGGRSAAGLDTGRLVCPTGDRVETRVTAESRPRSMTASALAQQSATIGATLNGLSSCRSGDGSEPRTRYVSLSTRCSSINACWMADPSMEAAADSQPVSGYSPPACSSVPREVEEQTTTRMNSSCRNKCSLA